MRIIGGSLKGRRLDAPAGYDVRPTADRARQALFDILAHSPLVALRGALAVDAFAGSGALGLEALSRGAAKVWLIDNHPPAQAAIAANIARLDAGDAAFLLRNDATKPPPAPAACTLALLDPPYRSGLAGPALVALAARSWLAEDALVVVELAATEDLEPPPGFEIVDTRVYGAAKMVLLTRE